MLSHTLTSANVVTHTHICCCCHTHSHLLLPHILTSAAVFTHIHIPCCFYTIKSTPVFIKPHKSTLFFYTCYLPDNNPKNTHSLLVSWYDCEGLDLDLENKKTCSPLSSPTQWLAVCCCLMQLSSCSATNIHCDYNKFPTEITTTTVLDNRKTVKEKTRSQTLCWTQLTL